MTWADVGLEADAPTAGDLGAGAARGRVTRPSPGVPPEPGAPLLCRTSRDRHLSKTGAHLAKGVVMVLGADGGVGLPDGPVAVAVMAYEVPGERPFNTQSIGTEQVTVMGLPTPMGAAVRV